MLYLSQQLNFQDDMARAIRGQEVVLEPGYAELYAAWEKKNEAVLYKWSAEERTQSFADAVDAYVAEKINALSVAKNPEAPTPDELKREELARRGALLLVSQNGGKDFDQVLTWEELKALKDPSILVLSPTLRSTTLDAREVSEEQELLHVVKKLKEQNFQVEEAVLENHQIKVKAQHPKTGQEVVHVDLDQPSNLALEYTFIGRKGEEKRIIETQLPEKFGVAEVEPSVRGLDTESVMTLSLTGESSDKNRRELDALGKAGVAGLIPTQLTNEMQNRAKKLWALAQNLQSGSLQKGLQNSGTKSSQNKQELSLKGIEKLTAKHLSKPLQNEGQIFDVQASKKDLAARRAREQGDLKKEQDRIVERYKKHAEESRANWYKKQLEKEERSKQNKQKNRARRQSAAIGAAVAGGAFTALMGAAGWSALLTTLH